MSGTVVLLAAAVGDDRSCPRQKIADHLTRWPPAGAPFANHIAVPLDMTASYTTPASYFDQITSYPAWKSVPRGFQVFDNVPLDIGGMICLWGGGNAKINLNFPEQILGIAVNQKFQTLYVYHGSFFASPDKTPVCGVVFRYEDGSSVTNELLYGTDMLDWTAGRAAKVAGPSGPNSKLAWVGGTFTPGAKQPLRLCLTAIERQIRSRTSPSRPLTCIPAKARPPRASWP